MTISTEQKHAAEVASGQRFEFGKNWQSFLRKLDDQRIAQACSSLQASLGVETLRGVRVLDIGCGSGLFSLAAMLLSADSVHSIDFDPASVACAEELKRRFIPKGNWTIEHGSVLDAGYIQSLGEFDLVYSWGVLHHTGDMYRALENAALPVGPGGRLFISIYNDQGSRSHHWRAVKRTYASLPDRLRTPFVVVVMGARELRYALALTLRGRARSYIREWTDYKRARGMSRWHDMVDWCGGYPFEFAMPEEIFAFYRARGFVLDYLKTNRGGLGCNEYVFHRVAPDEAQSGV